MPGRAILCWLFVAAVVGALAAALTPARAGLAAPRDVQPGGLGWRDPAGERGPAADAPDAARPGPTAIAPAAFWEGELAQAAETPQATTAERHPADDRPEQAARRAAADAPLPLRKPESDSALPLAPRDTASFGDRSTGRWTGDLPPLATAAGSLAVVLSLFFVTAWLLRRSAPRAALTLPSEVVEVLGRAPLPGKQQVFLVRCGQRLLLVWAGAGGVETLTEITDPAEVDRLAGICRAAHPHSATAAFRNVFQQLARDPASDSLTAGRATGSRSFRSGRRTEDDDA